MRYVLATTMTVLAAAANIPANAQSGGDYCPKVPREQMIPVETVQQKVKEMGYEVRRTRFDDGCYKVYITEKTTGGEAERQSAPSSNTGHRRWPASPNAADDFNASIVANASPGPPSRKLATGSPAISRPRKEAKGAETGESERHAPSAIRPLKASLVISNLSMP